MIENLPILQKMILHPAMAEMWVLTMAALTLIVGLFASRDEKRQAGLTYTLVQLTLVVSLFISAIQIGKPHAFAFHGLYLADDLSSWLKIFIAICALGSFYYAKNYIQERGMPQVEYYLLGLLSVLGMMVLCSSHSLLMVYLGLETFSLSIYAMIALRRDTENALESAIKYFTMGAIASSMLLYGMSMLYGATGSLDFTIIAHRLTSQVHEHSMLLSFALVFLIAGVGFKMASVPFHMWAPDVYAGSPTSVTLFLSTTSKLAALGMTMRLLIFALPELQAQWQPILIVLAVLSTLVGNILAIVQTNIKRLLAYSAISHLGYTLFGLIAGTSEGYAYALFYILIYGLMGLASFGLMTVISRHGLEAATLEDFKGLNARNPWLAFLMMLVMFSLAGVPPMIGFFSKLLVLKALVDVHLTWLAIFGLMMAVIGAFYYIRVVKVMYFDAAPTDSGVIQIEKGPRAVLTVNILALLFLGMFPGFLIQACLLTFNA